MKIERHFVVAAVHLILIKKGRILLLRRYNTGWSDGKYSVVAGHLERNETVESAMVREAMEEAGISVGKRDLEFAHVMHRKSAQARKSDENRIDFFFRARKWRGVPKNMEPDKCDDLRWFELDALPENMVPYVRHVIADILSGKTYSEVGW
jgi:8-oxo-dGTP pyrophosphatase MutT (NUDIX family)